MNFQQILLVVWARRKAALITLAATVAIVTLVSLLLPKQYVATSSLVLDVKADPVAGAVLPGLASPGYIATQMDIIKSDRVASRVVKLLRIGQNQEAVDNWKDATDGKTPLEYYYGRLMQRRLTIEPARGSNVINLSYAGSDPQFAAAVANAWAQAYVDVNVELRTEPARQYVTWFDERLKTLRSDLEKAQAKLSAYQQEKGIVATDDKLDHETARLAALSAQLAEAEGQRADSSSREKNSGSEISPDVMASPVILSIKSEIAKAEAKRSELDSTLGRNHPQYKQNEAQIAGLKQQLNEEIRRISGSAATATRVTSQKEEELKAAIEAQKQYLLKLRSERDNINILVRDVESAQRAYEAVAQRTTLTSLESQMQQNNVSILSPALEPDAPARPRVLLNFLASIVVGAMLGMGVALGLEKLDQRVRYPDDLVLAPGIPLLGILQPQPIQYSWQERLAQVQARIQTYLRRWRRSKPDAAGAGV